MIFINYRWFQLECGELRYYKNEQISQETLKGEFHLRGCIMPVGDGNEGERITITRADGFSLVMMGNTTENAREWRSAIKETLDILNSIYGDSRSTSGKIRRSNLATYYDDNENIAKFEVYYFFSYSF